MSRLLRPLAAIVALVTLTFVMQAGEPAQDVAAQGGTEFVYTASFVCGDHTEAFGRDDSNNPVYEKSTKVANYAFKLDLYNPDNTNSANLTATFNILDRENTPPPGRWPNPVGSPALPVAIVPVGEATMIDCIELAEAVYGFPIPGGRPYLSGVVNVRSDIELIAWSTHTMCSGGSGLGVSAVDVGYCGEALTHTGGDATGGLGASIDTERVLPLEVALPE